MSLIVFTPTAVEPKVFVEFWSKRYDYAVGDEESLYDDNIKGPHDERSLKELFRWKIGKRFFEHQYPKIRTQFISHLDDARRFAENATADAFLESFPEGGAIYRIFWIHCWNQKFPIYDQHVHRAMRYIEDGQIEELPNDDDKKLVFYRTRYQPFIQRRFADTHQRKTDQSLWAFGKFIKEWVKKKND